MDPKETLDKTKNICKNATLPNTSNISLNEYFKKSVKEKIKVADTFSIFVYASILLTLALPCPLYLSPPILSWRNAVVAIIKAGRTAASESGGQKRNKTSEISGQLPGAKVK